MLPDVSRRFFLAVVIATASLPPALAAGHGAPTGELVFDGDTLILDLVGSGEHPLVVVDTGDGKTYRFIVDTGAGVSVIDSAIATERGYEVVGELPIGAPGSEPITTSIVSVPTLRIGAAELRNAGFVSMDLDALSGGSLHGVLSLATFADFLVTFDYRRGHIEVRRGNLRDSDPGVAAYDYIGTQLQVELQVAGKPLPAHVDTGSIDGFTLPVEWMDSLPLRAAPSAGPTARLVGGDRATFLAQLDGDIVLAGTPFKDPQVTFLESLPGVGNIGNRILREFVTTIDQENRLIRFARTDAESSSSAAQEPRRLGLMFRATPDGLVLQVDTVVPGSLAESAGFQAGDVLEAINGKPAAEFSMPELAALFRSSTPLQIDAKRDGQPIRTRID